jgi:hypothetical protein
LVGVAAAYDHRPTSRETTIATYPSPASISSITSPRANHLIGTTSLRPVCDRVVKLRNRSSLQVRSGCGSTAAVKLPGSTAWQTV